MDLKRRPSFAAKCFGCALHTATGGQWMTWICSFFLVFICFLIVSFPFHWAPILSRNKNLTLMRERGFDFHFPLRVWHIFLIFLLVQLIISVWRACDTIPGAACRARRERGKRVCTTPVFAQLSRSGLPSKKKKKKKPNQQAHKQFNGYLWCSQVVQDTLLFIPSLEDLTHVPHEFQPTNCLIKSQI